ncbi:hypothetical protein OROHE_005912 [Orobanche hederae]
MKAEEETWSSSSTLTFPSDSNFAGQSSFADENYVIKSYRSGALSTLIPGLKKLDKASSVLEDAIKYMKQLQDKVKALGEQNKKRAVETVVFVKKYECSAETSSSDENFNNGLIITETVPETEANCPKC